MYPEPDLTRLAAHKVLLQRRITRHRADCVEAMTQVVQPLAWLDRALDLWRKMSPLVRLAAVPLGLLVQRTVFPRKKILGSLFRWGPLIFNAVRGIGATRKSRGHSDKS